MSEEILISMRYAVTADCIREEEKEEEDPKLRDKIQLAVDMKVMVVILRVCRGNRKCKITRVLRIYLFFRVFFL